MEWTGLAAVIFIVLEQIGIYREKMYCATPRRITEFPGLAFGIVRTGRFVLLFFATLKSGSVRWHDAVGCLSYPACGRGKRIVDVLI